MSTKAKHSAIGVLLMLFTLYLFGQNVTKEEFNRTTRDIYNEIKVNKKIDKRQMDTIEYLDSLNKQNFKSLNQSIERLENELDVRVQDGKSTTDRLWVLIAAALVFFMQAGFAALESGLVRTQHVPGVAMKNLIDWVIVSLAFTFFGFAIMFGYGGSMGVLGNPFDWILDPKSWENLTGHNLHLEFFIFQLAFASTAATIVSGALAERQFFFAYILTSALMGLVIYPVFGHWAWSGYHFKENEGWLQALGFHDFAGSTVVHSIGGWVSLAGIIVLKPRTGRFLQDGTLNSNFGKPANLGLAVLGVFILWFGWWGFNGGSILFMNDAVIGTIVNTNTAGAMGGLTAFSFSFIFDKVRKDTFGKTLGGVLGGLVAVTASCDMINILQALLVGFFAGIFHNIAYDTMIRFKLDDPVGAVPVHLVCGIWGTLFVGLVKIELLTAQFTGILSAFVFTFLIAFGFFKLLNITTGLRISPEEERNGDTLGTGYPF